VAGLAARDAGAAHAECDGISRKAILPASAACRPQAQADGQTHACGPDVGRVTGIAAALCVRHGVQPRQVDPARLQEMLLEQGSAIFYYKDVPPSHPQFRTIQRLSMAGVVRGDDDFRFRPDEQATKAEVASMLFHGLNLKVKLDYSQLFQVMRWSRHNQFCTPDHWGTARALGVEAAAHPALSAEAKKAAGPVTLAQVCALVERLRAWSPR